MWAVPTLPEALHLTSTDKPAIALRPPMRLPRGREHLDVISKAIVQGVGETGEQESASGTGPSRQNLGVNRKSA